METNDSSLLVLFSMVILLQIDISVHQYKGKVIHAPSGEVGTSEVFRILEARANTVGRARGEERGLGDRLKISFSMLNKSMRT